MDTARSDVANHRQSRVILWVCLGLVAVIAAAIAWDSHTSYSAHRRVVERQMSTLAAAAAFQVESSIRAVDLVLEEAAHAARTGTVSEAAVSLRARIDAIPEARDLLFIGPNGRLQGSSVGRSNIANASADFSDRDYFRFHREHWAEGRLYLGAPVTSRLTGLWVLPVARPLVGAEGKFGGVVVMGLDPAYFQRVLRTVVFAEDMAASVRRRDGVILARQPDAEGITGLKVSMEPLGLDQTHSGIRELPPLHRSPEGGVERTGEHTRLVAFHALDKYPLVVTVSMPVTEAFEDWRQRVVQGATTAMVLAFAVLALAILLERRETARAHLAARLEGSHRDLEERVAERTAQLESHLAERKRTEQLLQARLRLAQMLDTHSFHELLVATLDEACALTGSEVGFYHFLEADQSTLMLQAWSTRTTREFCTASTEEQHYPVEFAGVWADAVRLGHSVIYNDYENLPNRKGLPQGHAPVRRLMSIPILRDGAVVAIIGVGNKSEPYGQEDLVAAETLADMAWDLAEHKRAELERDQAAGELRNAKEAAEARSQELAASNAELEQFAYVASHDLRQPLRMVSSYLTLMERRLGESLDKDCREYLDFARNGAVHMDRLIRDLLEYSRVGRHGQPPEQVNLAEAADEASRHLALLVQENGGTLEVDSAPAWVMGNGTELTRLFQNLMGNAVKYREPGRPPVVRVRWLRRGGEWVVSVADNGIGIPENSRQDVFKIFRRLHSNAEYEGTGIGLAVCRKIVDRHGGRIWIEDGEDGVGTVFLFSMPAVE